MDPKWIKPLAKIRAFCPHKDQTYHIGTFPHSLSLSSHDLSHFLLFHRSRCPCGIVDWYSIGAYLLIWFVMEFSPFWVSLTVDCETGEQSTLTAFVCHLQLSIFKCMKCSRRPAKSNRRCAGWTGETYQESDSDNGPEPCHRPKDPHPHVIISATPASTQSSVVNAFTQPAALPKPTFEFADPPPSNDNDAHINYEDFENMDSFFQEYGLMDPELSAAWDEDHGLKSKRARTASVSKLTSLLMATRSETISCRTTQCSSGGITAARRHWMRCCGLRGRVYMQIHHAEDVWPTALSIVARIASAANCFVKSVLWQCIGVAHSISLRWVIIPSNAEPSRIWLIL